MFAPRHRSLRIGISLVASLSLLSSLTATALGATSISVNIVSSPIQVTRGQPVSYVISIENTGNNTANHATLEADTPAGFTYRRALTTQGSCNAFPAQDPLCSLGSFAGGTDALVVLIFDTDPNMPTGGFNFLVTVRAGEGGQDQPHSAHTDTFSDTAATSVVAASQDFTVHYIVPEGDDITTGGIFGTTSLSAANPQGTQALVPATTFGLPAAVGEVGGANTLCPPAFIGRCFGQASAVSVGNGVVIEPYLVVQVRFDFSLVGVLNDRKLGIIHWFDDNPFDAVPPTAFEEITTICSDATPEVSELPCRLPLQRMPDKDSLVTVFMESNGFIKGKG